VSGLHRPTRAKSSKKSSTASAFKPKWNNTPKTAPRCCTSPPPNPVGSSANRILQRHDPNAPKVIVDCERYRERAKDDLLRRVLEAADKVRRWGDPVHIGPYSAFERRIIHRHFASDYELEAISEEGDEAGRKKMTIRIRQTPMTAPGQNP
jgi:hypothetical protein